MQFEGAVVREQNVTFAIVIVKKQVIDNHIQANDAIRAFGPAFPGLPVVLMAQDSRGTPTYFGRRDISQFLSCVQPSAIPWKRYSVN